VNGPTTVSGQETGLTDVEAPVSQDEAEGHQGAGRHLATAAQDPDDRVRNTHAVTHDAQGEPHACGVDTV